MSVPRVIGSADSGGPTGGFGTSYLSGKIALLSGSSGVKVAVSPIIEILGESPRLDSCASNGDAAGEEGRLPQAMSPSLNGARRPRNLLIAHASV